MFIKHRKYTLLSRGNGGQLDGMKIKLEEMEKRMLKEKDSKSFLNFLKQLISDLDCVLELFLALQTNVKVLKG